MRGYSGWYIAQDPHVVYFSALVQMFVFFMLCLLLADSVTVMFLGWEGIGILSFLLISFWQTRIAALQAAMQGFIINRVGDLFLILALVVLIVAAGSNRDLLLPERYGPQMRHWLFLLLLGGAAGKSAQLGLHA